MILASLRTVGPTELSDLHCHITHLVGNTALPFNKRIDLFQGFEQCPVPMDENEVELFAQEPSTLEIGDKSFPGCLILYIAKLKG